MADMVARPAFSDVDPERQVVIEEIAMYLDDPQDTVFDVLGEAVFGDHPLGRSIIGRAPVIADTPVDVIRDFHAARYVPSRIVIAAAGSVDHDAIVELAEPPSFDGRRSRRRCPDAGCAGRAGAPRCASSARTPSRCTSCLGARRPRPRRRPALRRPRARRDLRRAVLVAAVPGRARGARPGLQRLLVRRPVLRHGPDRPVRRHAAGQPRRRRWRSCGTELDAAAGRARRPPRSSSGPRRTSRRASSSAWSPPARA